MTTIKIQKEAIPIIKSGLAIEENLLKTYSAYEHVRKKLKLVEEILL